MAGLLESLSQGLRGAGAIMSPDVYRQQNQEEQIANQLQEQRKTLIAQQVIKGAESGAIPPEQAKATLAKIYPGMEMPAIGPSPEAQQRMALMENERGFRAAIGAAGDDEEKIAGAAMQFGKPELAVGLINRKQDRIARAAQQADVAEQRIKENDRMHEYRMAQAKTDADRAAEMSRHNQISERLMASSQAAAADARAENRQFRTIQLQMMGDTKARALLEKDDAQIEKQIGTVAHTMKDIQPVFTAAKQLNSILGQYTPDTAPGLGYAKNTSAGAVFLSQEGKDVASSVKQVGNSILKAMSGAAVTPSEEVRQMAASMADGRFSGKDFYAAWPKISAWINDQHALAAAPLTPKARERFQERTNIKLDPIVPKYTTETVNGVLKFKENQGGQSTDRQKADEILGLSNGNR